MGIDLTYEAEGKRFDIRWAPTDWHTVEKLRKHLPDAVATCFDVPDFGEPVCVELAKIRASVEELISLLETRPKLLPYTYQFKVDYIEIDGTRHPTGQNFGAGMYSGFQLPGDGEHRYSITAFNGELWLSKMRVRADGNGEEVKRRDLRGEKSLMTANCGCIQFRKRRAKSSLRKGLEEIRIFLAGVTTPRVTKILG